MWYSRPQFVKLLPPTPAGALFANEETQIEASQKSRLARLGRDGRSRLVAR